MNIQPSMKKFASGAKMISDLGLRNAERGLSDLGVSAVKKWRAVRDNRPYQAKTLLSPKQPLLSKVAYLLGSLSSRA